MRRQWQPDVPFVQEESWENREHHYEGYFECGGPKFGLLGGRFNRFNQRPPTENGYNTALL